MHNIIFVDDDDNILQGIRRSLRPMREQWSMTFANGGTEALNYLQNQYYDAIISDTRMPGMSGIELLDKVKELYPHMVRIGLSGTTEEEFSLLSSMSTHQQLTKPCDKDTLTETIKQALAQCSGLTDSTIKKTITASSSLPTLPSIYTEITRVMESDTGTLKQVADLITQDMAISAKILQLVNSSFFGVSKKVTSPQTAVSLLGLETVKALVLSAKILSQFDQQQVKRFKLDSLWDKSAIITQISKQLSAMMGSDKAVQDYAQTASLLLDIGVLIMIKTDPDIYQQIINRDISSQQELLLLEKRAFACTHPESGASLLGVWGLPESVVSAVKYHLQPSLYEGDDINAITVVHLAHAFYLDNHTQSTDSAVDMAYIDRLNLTEQLTSWQQAINQTFFASI